MLKKILPPLHFVSPVSNASETTDHWETPNSASSSESNHQNPLSVADLRNRFEKLP